MGSITSVQAVYVPADDLTDPAPATTFAHLDATTVLSRQVPSPTHTPLSALRLLLSLFVSLLCCGGCGDRSSIATPAVAHRCSPHPLLHLHAVLPTSKQIAELGIYPAVDPLDSTSRMLDPRVIGEVHYSTARATQKLLQVRPCVRACVVGCGCM